LKGLADELKEMQPHLKGVGRREKIGLAIELIISDSGHRLEFVVYPGYRQKELRELALKIYLHMKGLSKQVRVGLYQQLTHHKHKTLLGNDQLHSYKLRDFLAFFKKFIPRRIRKPKHLVLHQENATGGALFGHTIHNRMYSEYYSL
jgi:hypothetical protein